MARSNPIIPDGSALSILAPWQAGRDKGKTNRESSELVAERGNSSIRRRRPEGRRLLFPSFPLTKFVNISRTSCYRFGHYRRSYRVYIEGGGGVDRELAGSNAGNARVQNTLIALSRSGNGMLQVQLVGFFSLYFKETSRCQGGGPRCTWHAGETAREGACETLARVGGW